ncbi:MAG: MFS transporter, partial [Blastocatellia bacterium]
MGKVSQNPPDDTPAGGESTMEACARRDPSDCTPAGGGSTLEACAPRDPSDCTPAGGKSTLEACAPTEPWLSRGAIIIGIVSLFADISTEVMYPLLPTFVTRVLGAPVAALGIIEGVANGSASIVGGLSGWLSDRIGRRKQVAFAGYVLTAISKPLIGVAWTWHLVLGARFSDRFGKGIRSAPRDALLSESAPDEHRGRAFGFERAMDSSGALIGPLLAVLLVGGLGVRDRTVFYLATIPALIAALLILAVPEKPSQLVRGSSSLRLTLAGTSTEYRRLLIVTAVFGLGNSADAFIILRAQDLHLGLDSTILAYGLYNAISAIVSLPAGSASDRFGRRNLLI